MRYMFASFHLNLPEAQRLHLHCKEGRCLHELMGNGEMDDTMKVCTWDSHCIVLQRSHGHDILVNAELPPQNHEEQWHNLWY